MLCLSPQSADALVRLPNCPVDASISVGLYLVYDGFGFCQELVTKPVGLTFELINPILGLPQLN